MILSIKRMAAVIAIAVTAALGASTGAASASAAGHPTAGTTVVTHARVTPDTVGSGDEAAVFVLSQVDWSCGTSAASSNVELVFQCDGNLVLYDVNSGVALWATGTWGKGVTDVDWSASGYIKLKNSSGAILCTVGALSPAPGGIAMVQDDGNFVFYDTSGNPTWSSGTYGQSQGNTDYCYT